ncbi:MAG TPA: hypothetical protein VF621_13230 [Pyrinomonadaceae bacterium]
MSKLKPARLLLPLALLFALAPAAVAQTDARSALSGLPDSQAVVYINAHRVIHEVMPRVMPPAEYAKMIDDAQKFGFDARGIYSVAVAARLADPPPANNLPEFVVVIRGNFNGDPLLALRRAVAGSQNISPRSETYGSKTLEIIDLESLDKKPEGEGGKGGAKPKPMPYPAVAVMALDANTLVAGVPSYVKAVVDAAGGRGGLSPSMLDLAARDPQALWSLTVDLPPSLVDHLHKAGVPANEQTDEMIRWVKQVSLAQSMDTLNYTMSASVLTDAPEHASAFSGLVRMGLIAAQAALNSEAAKQTPKHKDYAQTRAMLAAMKTVVNRTEGNTLLLSASFSQKAVHDLLKKEVTSGKLVKRTARPARRGRARRR